MAIPKEILEIERPKSTRVKLSGGRYLVIKRTSKRVGNRTVPVELGTIGEIKDGRYVEIRKEPRRNRDGSRNVEIKDYGEAAVCDAAGKDILSDLKEVYDAGDALRIYTVALLRASFHDIRDRDIKMAYETSCVSDMYPGIHLSENTLSSFLEETGMAYSKISAFMRKRVEKFSGKQVVVDGMLKDCNSTTDTFSEFSRKGAKKGSKDLSLIYAYDTAGREPVACRPYPGNMPDMASVKDFIAEFRISSGILVMDKGFYSAESIAAVRECKDLKYLIPLKQNAKAVTENGMNTDFSSLLPGCADVHVFYKKKELPGGIFLYAFKDVKGAHDQETGYIARNCRKGSFSGEKYLAKKNEFGTIVFESNADMEPAEVYAAYAKRWEIEVLFDFYKNILELNTTRVHGDYRLYATEFINFLSVIISCRVRKLLETTGISGKYSYSQVFRYLSKIKKVRTEPNGAWTKNVTVRYITDLAAKLGV